MSSLHHLPPHEVSSFKGDNEMNGDITNSINNEEIDLRNGCNGISFGKSFESLHIFNDEEVVIASSNLYGPQMNGYITKYKSIGDVPLEPLLSLNPNYGGCYNLLATKEKHLICGFDSGHIMLLTNNLEEKTSKICHDNQISSLNVNKLEDKLVSCGYDSNIVLFDLHQLMAIKVYNFAHSSYIWDVDFNKFDDNILLSCSRDRNVLLWDTRIPKPASLVVSCQTEATCVCWSVKDTSHAFIGDSEGHVMSYDVRYPGIEVTSALIATQKIHKINNISNGDRLAICADENCFYVCNCELDVIYKDNTSHTDWIRAAYEHRSLLYTVGRDTKLISHNLSI